MPLPAAFVVKRLEDPLVELRRDADAGVLDLEDDDLARREPRRARRAASAARVARRVRSWSTPPSGIASLALRRGAGQEDDHRQRRGGARGQDLRAARPGTDARARGLAVVCYTLQIYFDFSGYSDMAVGLGKMFGFVFLENFNFPYTAQSIKDFWRRWHISLSTWFRDYLYIPMGGNRCPVWRNHLNLVIVFFLCGLVARRELDVCDLGPLSRDVPGAGADAIWRLGGRGCRGRCAIVTPCWW